MEWGAPGINVDRRALRSPPDVRAVEAVPPLAHLPGATIYTALRRAAADAPDRPAIRQLASPEDDSPRTITFRDYLEQVERAANLFHVTGAGEKPVVAILAPFVPEAFIAAWAATLEGVYVPINPFLEPAHVAGIMAAAGVNILVAATDAAGPGAWSRLGEIEAALPTLRATFRIDSCDDNDFMVAAAIHPAGAPSFEPVRSPDAVCAYLHTGGTTATPKLVRHTQGGQLLQGWLCGTAMGSAADDIVGHAMPNFHVGGAVAVGVRGLVFAQTVVTLTSAGFRNPGVVPAFWDIVERCGITTITVAPTTAAAILDGGGGGPRTLRRITTGGGPLPPSLARALHARWGLHTCEVWGGTEFHGILSFHFAGEPPRLGSCGRVVPYHQVIPAILDGSRFVREARRDERGILIACGPSVVPGYVDPANDAQFFVEGGPDGHRWASTGDVGTVDEDGFVWIFGREKDVIIRGGHNIDSALIDDAFATHPAVLHAAAVGKPCPVKGELPMAYVALRTGAAATTDELLAHARAHIQERAAVPVEIVLLDALPVTAVGKVSKPPLRLDAIRRVAEETVRDAVGFPMAIAVEERAGQPVVTLAPAEAALAARLEAAFGGFAFRTEIREG